MEILKKFGFFNSAALFSNQLFSNPNWTNSELLEFLKYLNSYVSYKQKKNFYF